MPPPEGFDPVVAAIYGELAGIRTALERIATVLEGGAAGAEDPPEDPAAGCPHPEEARRAMSEDEFWCTACERKVKL